MMGTKGLSIRCKNDEPFVCRMLAGNFTWHIYNMNSGHIVASCPSYDIAAVLLRGIQNEKYMFDTYGITETWTGEPSYDRKARTVTDNQGE